MTAMAVSSSNPSPSSYPVSLSPSFFPHNDDEDGDGAAQTTLHAIQQLVGAGAAGGATLRVSNDDTHPGTGSAVQLGTLRGNMQRAPHHDCVLLWDEASQSYILHRLATITRLSGSKPHASTSSSSVHHPAGSDLKRDGKAKATSSRRTQQQQQREVSNDEIAGDRQGTLPSSPHHHATKVGLGISSSTSGQLPYPPSSSSTTSKPLERPTTSGPAAIEVEEFDADLASASSDEDGGGGGEGRGMAAAANKGKTAPAREQPQSPPPSIAATPTPTPTSTSSGPPQHHRAIAKKALPSSVLAAATSSSSSSSSKKKPSSSTGSGGSTKDTRKATATSDGGGAWQVNSLSYADVGIIPSDEEESDDEEEEDDEDEGDFDDLANDLEESLGLQHQGMVVEDEEVEEEGYGEGEQQAKDYRFPSAPSPPLPQPSPQLSTTTTTSSRPMVAGKKIPNQKPYKTYDSDIASSSESEDSD